MRLVPVSGEELLKIARYRGRHEEDRGNKEDIGQA